MVFGKATVAAGLDLGESAVKQVVLRALGNQVEVVHVARFGRREEGIMAEEDLTQHLATWLPEQGYAKADHVLGVPQYLAMAQLSDFPENAAGRLDAMVAYETQHLAGLTDEPFLSGYHQFSPFGRFRNPVLIGVCKQGAINNRLSQLPEGLLNVRDLVMDGQALAMAFFQLQPEAAALEQPTLLLNIGNENSTLALVAAQRILHVGSVASGGASFTHLLMRAQGLSEDEAERQKREATLDPADHKAPLTQAAQKFVNELEIALENWRFQSKESGERIHRMFICGGGARFAGLDKYLEVVYDCPVAHLGVPRTPDPPDEELVTAYGLALGGLPSLPTFVGLSLAPHAVKWLYQRRRRLPMLWTAVALLAVAVSAWLVLSYLSLTKQRDQRTTDMAHLRECEKIIPTLEGTRVKTLECQQMLRPFAAFGNRNLTMVQAIKVLGERQQEPDFLFMLADPAGYRDDPLPTLSADSPPPAAGAVVMGIATKAMTTRRIPTRTLTPLRELYAAGCTPYREVNGLESVQKTVSALNAPDSGFTKVDTVPPPECSTLNHKLAGPWVLLFQRKVRSFTLRLPLSNVEFTPEESPGT